MTIRFMVLGAPRSGTTWSANWLTSQGLLCLHDPLLQHAPEMLARSPESYGLACTGLPLYPDFVNAQECPKLILRRPRSDVDTSLVSIGLTPLGKQWDGALDRLHGLHAPFQDLFEPSTAEILWKYLRPDAPFERARHALLREMHVEPSFRHVAIKPERARAFVAHVREALSA